jgi:PAS domain S-box-containing protein
MTESARELAAENRRLRDELHTLQDRLDVSLSAGNLAWWEWDIPANRVTFNKLKVEMLGYRVEDFENVGYQAFTELLHPDDYEKTMQAMRDHLEGRAALYEVEYRIRNKEGAYGWYYDRGSITDWGPQGEPTRLKGIVFDISDRKRLERERETLITELRQRLAEIKALKGIIPVCVHCRKMRDDEGYWRQVDEYIRTETDADASHGICPDCAEAYYAELAQDDGA